MNPSQLAFADELLEPDEGRVILQEMPYHEDAIVLLRDIFELMGIGQAQRQRLLHEHVLAREKGLARQGKVHLGGSGDGHGVDVLSFY